MMPPMRTVGGRALVGFLMLASACGSNRGALTGGANDAATTGPGGASGDAGRGDGTTGPVDTAIDTATPTTDSGGTSDATGPIVDATCVTTHAGARLPVDVLLIFDRSGSMVEDPSTGQNCLPQATCPSKWNQATAAIEQAVGNTESTVRWGLMMFPSPSLASAACQVIAGAQVPIAPMNAVAITSALAATAPSGNTPTTAALAAAGDYLSTLTTPNQRFMVLVTDGAPTCGALIQNTADDANAIMAVTTQASRGFGTFVVGIATATDAQADFTLSAMSTAGMHPRPGTPNYYVTNNTPELVAALDSIASQVNSCTFSLDAVPPVPANVTVTGDGNIIPRNDNNGWVYEPGMLSITLTGEYCQRVVTGALQNVAAIFGC
jgi:von Willebrand factor type A domain